MFKGIAKGIRSPAVYEHSGRGIRNGIKPGIYKAMGGGESRNTLVKNTFSFLVDTPSGTSLTYQLAFSTSIMVYVDYGDGTNLSPSISTAYSLSKTYTSNGIKKITTTIYGPLSTIITFLLAGLSGTGGPLGYFNLSKFKSLAFIQITNPSFSGGYKNIINGIKFPQNADITDLRVFNAQLNGWLDLRPLKSIGNSLQINGNAGITGIHWPETVNAITTFLCNGCGFLGVLDFRNYNFSGLISVSNLSVTSILWGASSGAFTSYYRGNGCPFITSQDLSMLSNLGKELTINGCTNLSSLILPTNTNTFDIFNISLCSISYVNVTTLSKMTEVNNGTYTFTSNAMTAANVNQTLIDLDSISTNAFTGRSILIAGTNAAPTGAGLVAKTSLIAKGFTVTTN